MILVKAGEAGDLMMSAFNRLNLSRQFQLASIPILLAGTLLIAWQVGLQIEAGIDGMTRAYLGALISPHVQSLVNAEDLSEADRAALDQLLARTASGEDKIVTLRIWRRDGRHIVYSSTHVQSARALPTGKRVAPAFAVDLHPVASHLTKPESRADRNREPKLIEAYVPLHASRTGPVIATAELYYTTGGLTREARITQLQSWVVLMSMAVIVYVLLFRLVRRGSKTIDAQQGELNDKVKLLTELVAQNELLHDKVSRAAARTTALNEVFLRRISVDLHDGPGQDLGLALMQFESLGDTRTLGPGGGEAPFSASREFGAIRTLLQSALNDLRAISAGLQLPEVDKLSVGEIASRALRDYERKTGVKVILNATNGQACASLPVKITLYRLLQASLVNGFHHANGAEQRVAVKAEEGRLMVEVRDSGPGFDPATISTDGHFGLAGMRDRVEILGGSFDLQSASGQGTTIRVSLPLVVPGLEHEPP